MTKQEWIERCAQVFMDEGPMSYEKATQNATELASIQAESDGDPDGWFPPEQAARDDLDDGAEAA